MSSGLSRGGKILVGACVLMCLTALPLAAQYGPPHTTTSIGGHSLAPPPSVTSIGGAHSPPVLPSVTSIPNTGFGNHNGYHPYGYGHRNNGYGYGAGWGYAVPYYYPADGAYYGYDYVGGGAGPDLYSGPPLGPNDPVLHVIVEQPPARPYAPPPEPQAPPEQAIAPLPHGDTDMPDIRPAEPVVLVYRDGKKQEVTNYAIMGDTLYVFDQSRKKIALADLDLPATVKANDDRGMEFRMPPSAKKKAVAPAQQNGVPNSSSDGQPKKIAAVITQAE